MQLSPVAIGGIGGSGTRVIAAILRELGCYLGDDLNASLDNLWFTLLFKRRALWPVEAHGADIAVLAGVFGKAMSGKVMSGGSPLTVEQEALLETCVAEATDEHPLNWRRQRQASIHRALAAEAGPPEAWGWKEQTPIFCCRS